MKHEIEREITESQWNNFGVLYRTVVKITPSQVEEGVRGRKGGKKRGGGGELGWTNILVIR